LATPRELQVIIAVGETLPHMTAASVMTQDGRAPKTRPLKHRPCFIIMGVGECPLLCVCQHKSSRAGSAERHVSRASLHHTLPCPSGSHEQAATWLLLVAIGSGRPPPRGASTRTVIIHLSRCLPLPIRLATLSFLLSTSQADDSSTLHDSGGVRLNKA
jgi:hypothetical protein